MNIGIDASRYSLKYATGVEKYSFHIVNELIKLINKQEGHSLTLYTPKDFKLPEGTERVTKRVIPFPRLWTQFRLSLEMLFKKPDALFVPSHTLPLIRPKKSFIMIHDVAFKHIPRSYSPFQFWYLNWSTKFAVKHAYKIIVPSEATKKDIIRFYKCPEDKIVVIPHGYKPSKISEEDIKKCDVLEKWQLDRNPLYILFIGRLESKKNLVRLLKAYSKFLANYPDWRLVLAGKRGIGFKKIFKIATELKLWDHIVMPGYITETEKAVLLLNCQFFVFPSLYEGFGLPVLEAFAHGKAVLASKGSAFAEVAGDAAYSVDSLDPEEIRKGMEKLAENEPLREELIQKGFEKLPKFKWEEAGKRTFDLLVG